MPNIASKEQYLDLIEQTLIDLEELQASVEYDEEFMGEALEIVNPLAQQLRELLEAVRKDRHVFGSDDLPYMPLIRNTNIRILPFKQSFIWINDIHKNGYYRGTS